MALSFTFNDGSAVKVFLVGEITTIRILFSLGTEQLKCILTTLGTFRGVRSEHLIWIIIPLTIVLYNFESKLCSLCRLNSASLEINARIVERWELCVDSVVSSFEELPLKLASEFLRRCVPRFGFKICAEWNCESTSSWNCWNRNFKIWLEFSRN